MPRPRAPRPRKTPVQARSQATVDTILDAAARVLVRDGYGAFTTNRVAARAGVSVGSLYQYFPNKEALLAKLKARKPFSMAATPRSRITNPAVSSLLQFLMASHRQANSPTPKFSAPS